MGSIPRKHPSAIWASSADRCGCAMGARFLGATFVAAIAWFTWHWGEYSLIGAGVRILAVSFVGAIIGKLVGIAVYQLRTRKSRAASSRQPV